MVKINDDEKSDGLEIVSIGKLYCGSWEKKYWSSSRGKDRYPYPVGYSAVRTQHGITYKMEILEGLKGPLFMISCTEGKSCSGQTPVMAWNRFQKKDSSQVKLWHGKRFSCKIDGVEFFGFKNPHVQRLLRELVANVSERAYPMAPPSTCSDVFEKANLIQCVEETTKPDILQHLEKSRVTRKRSRTYKGTNIKSTRELGGTMLNSENENHSSNTRNSPEFFTASDVDHHDSCSVAQNSLVPMNMETVENDGAKPSSPHGSLDLHRLNNLAVKADDIYLQKPSRHSYSDIDNKSIEQAGSMQNDKEFLGRSIVVNVHDVSINVGLGEGEHTIIPDSLQNVDSEILVPDTSDIPPEAPDSVKDDVTSTQMTDSDTLITESHPDDAHTNSEKNDFDSVKSMMTVLLPRALPLLKTFSRKRKKNFKSSKQSLSDKENPERGLCIDVSPTDGDAKLNSKCQRQMEHLPSAHSVDSNKVHIDAFIPDTFDDDAIGYKSTEPQAIHVDFAEPGPTSSSQGHLIDKTFNRAVSINAEAGVPLETCRSTFNNSTSCSERGLHIDISPTKEDAKQNSKSQRQVEHLPNCHSVPPNKVHKDAFIPDTYDDDEIVYQSTEQQAIQADFAEPGPSSSSQDHLIDKTFYETVSINAEAGLPLRTCRSTLNNNMPCTVDVRTHSDSLDQKCIIYSPRQETTANANVSGISGSQIPNSKDACGSEINLDIQNMPASKFMEVSSKNILNGVCLTSNIAKEALEEKVSVTDGLVSHLSNPKEGDISEELNHGLHLQALTYSNQYLKLIARYAHPMPIKSVLLSSHQNEIYICALCGVPEDEESIIFLYKTQIEGQNLGCPSFCGHSSIILPSPKYVFGRNITLEKSALQFTPDARFFVLVNSIKTPYCSDGNLKCSCGSCKANSCENNAVKIVQVKSGFVTVVTKLKTSGCVCCILVCEPTTLVAAEESGKLYLWVMNSSWSAGTSEYLLPTPDCIPPCTLELKKIPKVANLIIGHNGVGDFCLWDIQKHILVSKISSPNTPVQELIPVSLFRWRTRGTDFIKANVNETINEIMDATKTWMTETNKILAGISDDTEDVAIWLLVSGEPCLEFGHGSKLDMHPTWRLALLVNHTVIMGNVLDQRASGVGASAGRGIIGRSDGLVYIWELSTGINLGNLHDFKGGRMSCIAIDDSGSDVFAIGSNDGHLLVYRHL